jgi:hypothetical protein
MHDLPQDLYPSRGREERWLERQDPLTYVGEADGEQGLSEDQVAAYARDGFLILPGVFSREEARLIEAEFLALASDPVLQQRDELVLEPDDREPRTLVIHECNMLHGSPDNLSPHARSNLFFVYNSVLNTPIPQPFAATAFRPEFLARRDFRPLQPRENLFP